MFFRTFLPLIRLWILAAAASCSARVASALLVASAPRFVGESLGFPMMDPLMRDRKPIARFDRKCGDFGRDATPVRHADTAFD